MFSFPSSPSEGTTFSNKGRSYKYTSGAWRADTTKTDTGTNGSGDGAGVTNAKPVSSVVQFYGTYHEIVAADEDVLFICDSSSPVFFDVSGPTSNFPLKGVVSVHRSKGAGKVTITDPDNSNEYVIENEGDTVTIVRTTATEWLVVGPNGVKITTTEYFAGGDCV